MKTIVSLIVVFLLISCAAKKSRPQYGVSTVVKDSITTILQHCFNNVKEVNISAEYLDNIHLYGDYGPYMDYGWREVSDSCFALRFESTNYKYSRKTAELRHKYYFIKKKDSLFHEYSITMWHEGHYAGTGSAFLIIPYDSCLLKIKNLICHE